MSTIPVESTSSAEVKKSAKPLRKILLLLLIIPLVAFIAVEANVLRLEQQTEQKRRQIGAAGGRSETERRVPEWLQPVLGSDAHSFLDRTAIVGVTMTGEEIGDEQAAEVADLPDLRWLNLGESKVTSASLSSVSKLTSLRTLDLTNTHVSELTDLAMLPELVDLRLDYCGKVNLEHLTALSKLPQLRAFGANGLRLTDKGVALIANCTQLEQLNMMGSRLNQGGLQPLQKLKQLKQLTLTHSFYHPEDLAAFQEAVPECKVSP